jgi:hypothetical protein
MDKANEAQLFDHLCRYKPLREWLSEHMDKQVSVLMVNPDHGAVLKAQGAVAFIKAFQDRIIAAENSARR